MIFIFSLVAVSGHSQTSRFTGGVFLNLNGIQIEGESNNYWQNFNGSVYGGGGLSAGLSVRYSRDQKNYFNLELRYIQKGSVYAFSSRYGTKSFEVLRLNYVEVPVSYGHELNYGKRNFSAESGFAFAKLFMSEVTMNEFVSRTGSADARYFKDYDFSWFSMLEFPLFRKRTERLLLGLRFSYSLLTVHEYYKLRNMVYGLQLDYLFQ